MEADDMECLWLRAMCKRNATHTHTHTHTRLYPSTPQGGLVGPQETGGARTREPQHTDQRRVT
jgi:hypothetical protein